MLTARGHPDDVLRGFAAGADDYLPSRSNSPILIARIRGLLRRRRVAGGPSRFPRRHPDRPTFTFGDKSVHFDLLEIHVRDQVFPLTLMESEPVALPDPA